MTIKNCDIMDTLGDAPDWYNILKNERSNFNMWTPILLKILRVMDINSKSINVFYNHPELQDELNDLIYYMRVYEVESMKYTSSLRYFFEEIL